MTHLIEIYDENKSPVFSIMPDGKVFWRKDGELVEAKIDSELAQAFREPKNERL